MEYLMLGVLSGFIGLSLFGLYAWEYHSLNGRLDHSDNDIGNHYCKLAWDNLEHHKGKGLWVMALASFFVLMSIYMIWYK